MPCSSILSVAHEAPAIRCGSSGATDDITGARWSTPGAQAILRLRAVIANGDFAEYWQWHQQQELRNYAVTTSTATKNSISRLNP